MEVKPIAEATNQAKETRERSRTAFPYYGLADSVAVAKALYEKGGGEASKDHLAAFLEYKSADNGAFKTRVGAAKLFGLIESAAAGNLKISTRGKRVLMPESDEQLKSELVEAFFAVPLFKALFEEYKGRDLPEGLGLKNALRLKFGIIQGRIDLAYSVFFDSAETAGFFEIRGSKTQLIIPLIKSPPKTEEPPKQKHFDEDGPGNEPPIPPRPPIKSRDDLQNEYIATLIEVLREKTKEGNMDDQLMERIERLLDLKSA
jgi:hypothetical protein